MLIGVGIGCQTASGDGVAGRPLRVKATIEPFIGEHFASLRMRIDHWPLRSTFEKKTDRTIPLVRLPTTSLSQGDGGIGVKNGINYFGKKNWLGAFSVPHAVINDLEFLQGLPERERRCGLIEAV